MITLKSGAQRHPKDATVGSAFDCDHSRREDARRGRTARLLLQARPPGVRDGGDRLRAGAGPTALRQRPAPVRRPRKRQRVKLPPSSGEWPPTLPPAAVEVQIRDAAIVTGKINDQSLAENAAH